MCCSVLQCVALCIAVDSGGSEGAQVAERCVYGSVRVTRLLQ